MEDPPISHSHITPMPLSMFTTLHATQSSGIHRVDSTHAYHLQSSFLRLLPPCFPERMKDPPSCHSGTEAIVYVHHCHTRRTGVEGGEEGGHASERGSVTDAGVGVGKKTQMKKRGNRIFLFITGTRDDERGTFFTSFTSYTSCTVYDCTPSHLVGTAMTGWQMRPESTLGRAPSMPATTMMTSA